MWQEIQAELLRQELETLITPLSTTFGFRDLIKEPLTKARRGLAPNVMHDRPWALMPLIVCEALCGSYKHAIPAGAALQLFLAAGDVFDDIEDADCPDSLSSKYGSAIATNAATTLLMLAEKAITRLKERGVADLMTVRIINVVNSYYINACIGQHLDLNVHLDTVGSEDTYLQITVLKSASQIECACKVGALLARAKKQLVDIFAQFGYNLGVSSQIANDIQSIINGSDILKNPNTLPIIFALNQTDNQTYNQLRSFFSKPSVTVLDLEKVRDLLFRIGAIHYAMVKMEYYKQRAQAVLLKAGAAGVHIERLKLFLD
jgi:geranylgeranyl pyrophosphate synthase